jgi:Cu2+-exporting ATPase
LGVTLPLVDELAVARLRHSGVFVRAHDLWSRLRRIRKVIFDKTGTLTLESLVLRNPQELRGLDANAQAALTALVWTSRHPVASCLREALMAAGLAGDEPPPAAGEAVREQVGFGLEWTAPDGAVWRLGREGWAAPAGPAPATGGSADAVLGRDGTRVAAFQTGEEVRDDARAEVARMVKSGRSVFILSGDRPEKVTAMATHLGLPSEAAAGSMSPGGKADWVRSIDDRDTLMIGDGANDAMAFAAAFCRGTPAIERGLLEHGADFYFLGRGLAGIGRLLEAARLRSRTVVAVLGFAIVYNAVVVTVALAGMMSPLLAAVVMPASALVSLGIAGLGMRRV